MIDLIDFFYSDLKDKNAMFYNTFREFYYAYIDELNENNAQIKLNVYDVEDAITKFKNSIRSNDNYSNMESFEFIMACYFLYKNGYYIKQFPNFLERPSSLYKFSSNDIKNLAAKKYGRNGNCSGVAWHDRAIIVDELEFIKVPTHSVIIKQELEDVFKLVSTRNEDFKSMSLDEKLANIENVYAHIADSEKQLPFAKLTNNYITDEQAKRFNGDLQCFRHGEKALLDKRNQYSDNQKEYMVDFGLTILAVAKRYIDEKK